MSNPIQFWLKDRKGAYLRLPVNPDSLSLTSNFGINRVSVAGLGEVTTAGERELKEVSFQTFFPRDYNPTYCEYNNFKTPKEFVRTIEEWRDTRENIRLIISGTDISIPCLIPAFDLQPERAGHVGDIYFSISFTEYRAAVVRKVGQKRSNGSTSASRPTQSKTKPKSYTVKKGDSLWLIAKAIYGNGSKWQTIYNANKKVIGNNSNKLVPGQKLVIP
jgi:nucleoid-associated protein YgaU